MNLKRKDKIKLIPNWSYCYSYPNGKYKECPFFSYKMTNLGFKGRKTEFEYCKYLHKRLSIQDQVKDCGVHNDEFDFTKVDKDFLNKSREYFNSKEFKDFVKEK